MTITEKKSVFSILVVVGTSQGLLSLVLDKSPSGNMLAVCFNISSNADAESLPTFSRYSHWSGKGSKYSFTKTLLPFFRALPCRGSATRFPSPPSGKVSWLGKNLSYDLKEIRPSLFIASVRIALPNLRAFTAKTGVSKKIQTCAPLPERERSIEQGMPQLLQTSTKAITSSW